MGTSLLIVDSGVAPDLAACRSVLVVCVRPQDMTSLAPYIEACTASGAPVRVLCLSDGLVGDPSRRYRQARELSRSAAELGVEEVVLLEHAGDKLTSVPAEVLTADVVAAVGGADTILTVSDRDAPDVNRAAAVRAVRRAAWSTGSAAWFLSPVQRGSGRPSGGRATESQLPA